MGAWKIFCMLKKGMLKRPCYGYRSAKGHTHLFFFFAKTLVLKFQFCSGDFLIVVIRVYLKLFWTQRKNNFHQLKVHSEGTFVKYISEKKEKSTTCILSLQ